MVKPIDRAGTFLHQGEYVLRHEPECIQGAALFNGQQAFPCDQARDGGVEVDRAVDGWLGELDRAGVYGMVILAVVQIMN